MSLFDNTKVMYKYISAIFSVVNINTSQIEGRERGEKTMFLTIGKILTVSHLGLNVTLFEVILRTALNAKLVQK